MRGWRRSSRARARDASDVGAPTPGTAANPFAPLGWPPPPVEALLVNPAPEAEPQDFDAPTTLPPATVAAPTAPAPPTMITAESHGELLRLFQVVTNMCDHVIEYIETDRAERRMMLDTLTTLGRTITESAAVLAGLMASATEAVEARVLEQPEPRERVIGGSMPAGPEPFIDLRNAPAAPAAAPAPIPAPTAAPAPETRSATSTVMTTEIAVEVRGRFGDRWVDGFEICEVMETADGHRYRLRRRRDGVVLPELFDATSIRHVETFDQVAATNGTHGERINGPADAREANVNEANIDDATGDAGQTVNAASNYWSRS